MTWYALAATRSRRRWRTLRQLPAAERRLLLEAFCLLPLMAVALRLLGFRRLYAALGRQDAPPSPPGTHRDATIRIYRTSYLVWVAARHGPVPVTCLPRSLVLWWLLRRRGIETDLRIGVRRGKDHGFEAHAWVEYQGIPVNDKRDVQQEFTPFNEPITPGDRTIL